MITLIINLFFLASMVSLTECAELPCKGKAIEDSKLNTAKKRLKIERQRKAVGNNELGLPIQCCLRCNNFKGYHFQVSEHMHNDCFPANGLFLLDSDSKKQMKMPKFVELVTHNRAHIKEARWKCVYCSSMVSPEKFKKHFELNTKLQMALYIFQGCNEDIFLSRNKFSMSSAKQEFEEKQKEVANLLVDLDKLIITRSK